MLHCRTVADSVGGEGVFPFLNVRTPDVVRVGAMKKIRFLAPLVSLLLLSGCHGTRTAVTSRFKGTIPIKIEVVEGRARLSHDHAPGLHHVKMEVLISDDGWNMVQERGKLIETTDEWPDFKIIHSKLRYNAGISWVEVSGWCDEGKIKGYWTARFSRD